jgi:hypothetical protein
MTIETMLEEIRHLSVQDRKQLINLIVETLPDMRQENAPIRRSITELRGLGKEIWEGIDAQDYVDQLRDEWDHRP